MLLAGVFLSRLLPTGFHSFHARLLVRWIMVAGHSCFNHLTSSISFYVKPRYYGRKPSQMTQPDHPQTSGISTAVGGFDFGVAFSIFQDGADTPITSNFKKSLRLEESHRASGMHVGPHVFFLAGYPCHPCHPCPHRRFRCCALGRPEFLGRRSLIEFNIREGKSLGSSWLQLRHQSFTGQVAEISSSFCMKCDVT